jgi:hypothetical protein
MAKTPRRLKARGRAVSTTDRATSEGTQDTPGPARLAHFFYLVTPAAMLFALLQRPILDVDIFWQLRLGEMILRNGGPIKTEPFAATHLGEALAPVAWLAQAVFAAVRQLGGWTGLRIFDASIWLGGFCVLAAVCRRRGAAPLALLLALAVAFCLALPAASIRPQSFAVLGFGLLLALLRMQWSPAKTLLSAVPLFVLWQNLHPSVTVAAIALAATASVAWVRYFAHRRPSPPWLLSALTGLAALSVFATPAGFSILRTSAENARASIAGGASEWLPIWSPINHQFVWAVIATGAIAGWLLVRNPHRIDWEELAPAAALLIMTLTAYRFVLFWSLALVPVFARLGSEPEPRRRKSWSALVIAPAALAAAVALALLVRPTHFAPSLPLAGINKLRETGVRGTVFDDPPLGGPLIDAGYPDWVVAYDGRYYRYSPEEWRRYRAMIRGLIGPEELDRIYHPAAYVLAPGWNDALITALRGDRNSWREVYADGACVVFVRNKKEGRLAMGADAPGPMPT